MSPNCLRAWCTCCNEAAYCPSWRSTLVMSSLMSLTSLPMRCCCLKACGGGDGAGQRDHQRTLDAPSSVRSTSCETAWLMDWHAAAWARSEPNNHVDVDGGCKMRTMRTSVTLQLLLHAFLLIQDALEHCVEWCCCKELFLSSVTHILPSTPSIVVDR